MVVPSRLIEESPSSEHFAVFLVHLAVLHAYPEMQSSSVAQAVLHALPSGAQAKPSQLAVIASGHFPLPSQLDGVVNDPSLHVGARHIVSEPANAAQLAVVLPSHAPAAQGFDGSGVHAARVPCGFPFTGMHLPGRPLVESGMSHASHWPLHAVSQQTPSAQCPVPHSPSDAHALPEFFWHVPSLPGIAHELPTSHDALAQQTPSVHVSGAVHPLAPEHALPSPSAAVQVVPLQ